MFSCYQCPQFLLLSRLLVEHYCMHTVCRCGRPQLNENLSNRLLEIVGVDHRVNMFHGEE